LPPEVHELDHGRTQHRGAPRDLHRRRPRRGRDGSARDLRHRAKPPRSGLVIAWLERFQNLDRRWIFLGMAIAIVVPMLVPVSFAFRVDERVQALYDTVEALPAGSTVLVSADFDPTARPEIEPFFRAHLTHLFRKNVKVVIVTLWDTAPPLVAPIIEEMAKKY